MGDSCLGSPGDTLHVHHSYYVSGRNPWDYGSEELEVLCSKCHYQRHQDMEDLNTSICGGIISPDEVIGYVIAKECITAHRDSVLPWRSPESLCGYAEAYGISVGDITAFLLEGAELTRGLLAFIRFFTPLLSKKGQQGFTA